MGCNTGETCTTETLPNGSKLLLIAAAEPRQHRFHRVTLQRKDGWSVVLLSDNAAEWKEAGTRAKPALTLAQLKAIVLSPRWQKRVPAELVNESAHLFTPQSQAAKRPGSASARSSASPR